MTTPRISDDDLARIIEDPHFGAQGSDDVRGDLALDLRDARAALRKLVELKDGPRNDNYEREKPIAWEAARAALAGFTERAVGGEGG